jgi:hypothetical protein
VYIAFILKVYIDFIQSIAAGTTGRRGGVGSSSARVDGAGGIGGAATKERRRLERAFADSLRECFSDPAIISLVRRATHLRLKQQDCSSSRVQPSDGRS